MLSMSQHFLNNLVILVDFIFALALNLRIFTQSFLCISKGRFQLHGRATSLRRMCFIDNNCIVSSCCRIHFLIDHREFLQRGNNNTNTTIQSITKIPGIFILSYCFNCTNGMVKARNSLLQLSIQNSSVGNDYNTAEYSFVIIVMQGSQTICCPCNRI